MDIFVLLEHFHFSVGEIHSDDYAEHVSNQSELNLMRDIKSLPSIEAFQG